MPSVKTFKQIVGKALAKKYSLRQGDIVSIVEDTLELLMQEMWRGNLVEFRGFCSFQPMIRAGRTARVVRTGTPVEIPERATVKLRISSLWKEEIEKNTPAIKKRLQAVRDANPKQYAEKSKKGIIV